MPIVNAYNHPAVIKYAITTVLYILVAAVHFYNKVVQLLRIDPNDNLTLRNMLDMFDYIYKPFNNI